jgi:hypothetical protein
MPSPCPSCNKLCSLENGEPEVENLELTDGELTASIRLVRQSACCSEDMKEYTYEPNLNIQSEILAHLKKFHKELFDGDNEAPRDGVELPEFEASENGCDVDESGGGRYAKNIISISLNVDVICQSDIHDSEKADAVVGSFGLTDSTNAGSFDELV